MSFYRSSCHQRKLNFVLSSMTQPPDPAWLAYQQQMDTQNVNTLVVLHRVYGGFLALGSCCLFGYLVLFFGAMSASTSSKPPPQEVLSLFGVLWGAMLILAIALSVMNFVAANWLRDRRNWVGLIVIAALDCLTGILGIGLAVYTMIVLNRPGVRSTFQ